MQSVFLHGLICWNSISVILSRDVNYFEITGSTRNSAFKNSPQQHYVDIYTNYPHVETVVKNYEHFKKPGEKYVYPKSNLRKSNNYFSSQNNDYHDNIQSRRRGFYPLPENNDDLIKFDADVLSKLDTLQSDYGDFEIFSDRDFSGSKDVKNNSLGGENGFHFDAGRPKFKTGNNFSGENRDGIFNEDYLTNVQKIPRFGDFNNKSDVDDENVNGKLRELLKKYLVRLYKKRYETALKLGHQEEMLDLSSSEISDNIETLYDTNEAVPNNDKFYEVVNNANLNKLNATKSKLLDPTKLLILKNSTKLLANKFLSLFTIIQFPNSRCVGSNTVNYYEGTCYYLTECQSMNGTAMGSCANGYGVCCVFVASCGGTSGANCTYFESPNYPNYYPSNGTVLPPPASNGTIDPRLRYQFMMFLARQASTTNSLSCVFQVAKSSSAIRQLRVDFLDLELRGPTNGTCVDERLIISGQNINDVIPIICGYNTGQHVYIDVTDVPGPIQFSILSAAVERKRFRFRVCQLTTCTIPQNCLQYHTGVTGVITSFNYHQASSLSRSLPGYFNNLNYAICIRKESGYCTVTFTTIYNATVVFPFNLRNVDSAGQSTVPPGQAGAEIFSCPEDYIVINGIRLCGERLNDGSTIQDFTRNAPVTASSSGPIIVPVISDGSVTGRGFRLSYTQNRCPNT